MKHAFLPLLLRCMSVAPAGAKRTSRSRFIAMALGLRAEPIAQRGIFRVVCGFSGAAPRHCAAATMRRAARCLVAMIGAKKIACGWALPLAPRGRAFTVRLWSLRVLAAQNPFFCVLTMKKQCAASPAAFGPNNFDGLLANDVS